MKQLLQDISRGRTYLAAVDPPACRDGCVLVRAHCTILAGPSEQGLLESGQGAILARSRSRAECVAEALEDLRAAGRDPTTAEVFARLDEPIPLGYCLAGTVEAVGAGVTDLAPGDRVAAAAPHAEWACVPRMLVAKVPDGLNMDQAAMGPAAAVAIHAARLSEATLGEIVAIVGLDLIGLLAANVLAARGCCVLATDADASRRDLAMRLGAIGVDPAEMSAAVLAQTAGQGADAVIVAHSLPTGPAEQALCRQAGRIVLIASSRDGCRRHGPERKELTVCRVGGPGPGTGDDAYEQLGHDYPYGLVRWTRQRNLQAALAIIASGQIDTAALLGRRVSPRQAAEDYQSISTEPAAAIVSFCEAPAPQRASIVRQRPSQAIGDPIVAVIGAGQFARETLLPLLARTSARIAYVADLDADVARKTARKYRAGKAVTDPASVLDDPHVHAVFIATGHNAHAALVRQALQRGKHVFVERPLAMTARELTGIVDAVAQHPDRQLLVGFNHRFSRAVARVRKLLSGRGEPLTMNLTVNAGAVPPEHWLHDPVRGGGRIIGQAVAYLDLLSFVAGSSIRSVGALAMGRPAIVRDDKVAISLGFDDGSVATLNFFANGPLSGPREVLEAFSDGRVLKLQDCRELTAVGFSGVKNSRTRSSDWGFPTEITAFVNRIGAGGPPLIALEELVNVATAAFAAQGSLNGGKVVKIEAGNPA